MKKQDNICIVFFLTSIFVDPNVVSYASLVPVYSVSSETFSQAEASLSMTSLTVTSVVSI